jgi:hypothetical protein
MKYSLIIVANEIVGIVALNLTDGNPTTYLLEDVTNLKGALYVRTNHEGFWNVKSLNDFKEV